MAAVSTDALFDPDPLVRSQTAVALGEAWLESASGLPPTPQLYAEVARADAASPGVADAFFVTVQYGFEEDPAWGRPQLHAWMLGVLSARRGRRAPLSPVPGNDLEFHAHEAFDADHAALSSLLDWGYADVVALALDHGALPRAAAIELMTRLFVDHGQTEFGFTLATHFGVLHASAMTRLPVVELRGSAAHRLTRAYGYHRRWMVHWLFPRAPARTLPAGRGKPWLERLSQGGLALEPEGATLDEQQIAHIPFPDIPGATRRRERPRRDLALDLLLDPRGRVLLLRLVQAR